MPVATTPTERVSRLVYRKPPPRPPPVGRPANIQATPSSERMPKRSFIVSSPRRMTSLAPTAYSRLSWCSTRPAFTASSEFTPSARMTTFASSVSSPALTPQTLPFLTTSSSTRMPFI